MSKLLLVGGAGFIGTHLARRLTREGHDVTVLDSLHPQVHGKDAEFSAELKKMAVCVKGDVRRPAALRPLLLRDHEVIYWLAAETGTGQSMYRVRRYTDTNLGALATLFDLLVKSRGPVERVVLASSRAIYGEGAYVCPSDGGVVPRARSGRHPVHGWNPGCPICGGVLIPLATPEDSPPAAGSVYGWTKLGQEQLLALLTSATGVEGRVLRLQNVYGPGQSLRNPYTGVLVTFCSRALAGEPLVLYEDGEITRDFVHVDDAVAALAAAGVRGQLPDGPVNIGSGVPTTIRQAAETIRELAGSSSEVTVGGQFRLGDVRHAVADISRAGEAFGFRPTVDFVEGIRRLLGWVREQDPVRDRSAATAKELASRGLLKTAP
ncbi:MAG: NAD-dependent epimerase/dehydratase family protein [Gemmatimonadales bacterium]